MQNWVNKILQSFMAAVFQQIFYDAFLFSFFRHKIKVKLIVGHWDQSSLLEGKNPYSYLRAHVVLYSTAFVLLRPFEGNVPQLKRVPTSLTL